MKKTYKLISALFILIFVIAAPLAALKAERDTRHPEEIPVIAVWCVEAAASGGTTTNTITRSKSADTSPLKSSATAVRYAISAEERREIERMVASEGGYCDYEFQALVALCILNGCEADDLRPLDLFERGDFWLTHNVEPTETTKQAVSNVFDRGIFPTDEPVRYYYNPSYCNSPVHEQKSYVLTSAGCRFFKD